MGNCLTMTVHANAVAGLPLPRLHKNSSACAVDLTADFLNSAQLPTFVRVTGNDGFYTKSLLTKCLYAQFVVVRQFSLLISTQHIEHIRGAFCVDALYKFTFTFPLVGSTKL